MTKRATAASLALWTALVDPVRIDKNYKVSTINEAIGGMHFSAPLGTITVNVTNAVNGVVQNEITTNGFLFLSSGSLIIQQTLTINAFDLQDDGKLSLYVLGLDAGGTPIAYGTLLDRNFSNEMPVSIAVDKPMSFVQYHVRNLPLTVNFMCSGLYQMRTGKGGVWSHDCDGSITSLSTTTTINIPYMPDFGDQFLYSVSAYVDQSSSTSSGQYLGFGPTTSVADQNFDFSRALRTPGISETGADTSRPTLLWSLDAAADYNSVFAAFDFASGFSWYLTSMVFSPSRTSITFPELPDSLADFRPVRVSYFSVNSSAGSEGLYRSSSTTYRNLLVYTQPPNKSALIKPQFLQEQQPLSQRSSAMDFFQHANLLKRF